MKYRKKPIVIDAFKWTPGAFFPAPEFDELHHRARIYDHGVNEHLCIRTLEGDMNASIGDWIIKGVNGEFYPCKPDIFEKTYEAVE